MSASGMTPLRALLIALIPITLLRFALIGSMEVSPDEAYYNLWAQHPDWCYYSKGPGVATVIRAGTALFGNTEFGVRFFSPLLGLGTSLILYALGKRLYSPTVGLWSALLINVVPIFNVGSLVMTIDPLSIFFWSLSVYAFWRALEPAPASPQPQTAGTAKWWILAGASVGLGFLCKYTNAMLWPSLFLYLVLHPARRTEFRRPGLYLSLLAFLPALAPPLIWNSQHAWITLAHLVSRGKLNESTGLHIGEFAEFLGVHFGVYSPLICAGVFIALAATLLATRLRRPSSTKGIFLLAFSVPLLALYFLLSFKEAGEANWTAPAFVTGGVLAVAYWWELSLTKRWAAVFCCLALGLGAVLSGLTLNFDQLRSMGLRIPYTADPSTRLRGWKSSALAVESVRKQVEEQLGEKVFLIANSYQTASSLAFYMKSAAIEGPGYPPVFIPESQAIQNQYSFWPSYDTFVETSTPPSSDAAYFTEQKGVNPFVGRTALYVTDRPELTPPNAVERGFRSRQMIALLRIDREGLPLRSLRVFLCREYDTLPL